MDYRILEIIQLLDERVSDDLVPFTPEIMQELMFEGYKKDEIEEAISWIEVYQNQTDEESFVPLSAEFKTLVVKPDAYAYLFNMLDNKTMSEEYVDELLDYCLVTVTGDIDFNRLMLCDKALKFGKNRWAKEAFADFRSFSLRKDC